jgi:AraC-like DNA-binding protein
MEGDESPRVRSDLVRAASTRVPGDSLVYLRRARDLMDRCFAEPIDLERLADVAAMSRFNFHRLFSATYGVTPAQHLTMRRVERAQDLLRATNLTVTEVCFAVGYSSLGSFSARFKEMVGETPSEFQRRYARRGTPRIPGCFVFMRGLADRRPVVDKTANEEKHISRVDT